MKQIKNLIGAFLIGFASFTLFTGNSLAAESDFADKMSKKMLAAVMANDYEAFMVDKRQSFRDAITKELFQSLNSERAPRMKKGYENTYFGTFKRQGFNIYFWKLSYKDGGDDTLVTLTIQNGQVAGFWMQ